MLTCLSNEDKLLLRKADDLIELSEKYFCDKYSFFLDERQKELIIQYFNSIGFNNFSFNGGYQLSLRNILSVFPMYIENEHSNFPIDCILFEYRKQDLLSHRDFLGSLMSLQIKRELLGDIIVNNGKSYVFVHNSISSFLINNITKIGKIGVKLSICLSPEITIENKFDEILGTVASLRLDSIVALVTGLSREKASLIIKSNGIDVNYVNIKDNSFLLKSFDVFSLRKFGKFTIAEIGGTSKKGRIHIKINKYI